MYGPRIETPNQRVGPLSEAVASKSQSRLRCNRPFGPKYSPDRSSWKEAPVDTDAAQSKDQATASGPPSGKAEILARRLNKTVGLAKHLHT